MSAIDDLLKDYENVAEAARRLERSRDNHVGAHEFCCERGQCLKCEEAHGRAEADLHRALVKVALHPFRSQDDQRLRPPPELKSRLAPTPQREICNVGSGPAEYLRHFFTELERMKPRKSFYVSHAIGFRDERLYVLVSIGDFRERVYVDVLDENPLNAAQQVCQLWQAKAHIDEDIE